jgi:hypothetical protein
MFDEFLQEWLNKLKAIQGSNVAVRLQKDIEQMREFSNGLKFCRGEVFSPDHWSVWKIWGNYWEMGNLTNWQELFSWGPISQKR